VDSLEDFEKRESDFCGLNRSEKTALVLSRNSNHATFRDGLTSLLASAPELHKRS